MSPWLLNRLGYARYFENETHGNLETAVAHFENAEGARVDLIAAIHIGDPAYFSGLNELFRTYEAVLFEMVADPEVIEARTGHQDASDKTDPEKKDDAEAKDDKATDKAAPEEKSEAGKIDDPFLSFAVGIYPAVAKMLAAQSQMEGIDYRADNLIHADVSATEFNELQEAHGESFSKIAGNAVKMMTSASVESGAAQLMNEMFTGTKSSLRLAFGKFMASTVDEMSSREGMLGKVLIDARNEKALEVFDDSLKAGKRHMAIFYGAAHMPDMETRLGKMGFHRVGMDWRIAWETKKKKAPTPAAAE